MVATVVMYNSEAVGVSGMQYVAVARVSVGKVKLVVGRGIETRVPKRAIQGV